MPALEDVLRLVELQRRERPGHTDKIFVRGVEGVAKLSEAILEQGVEDWLDELVAEMAVRKRRYERH